MSQKAAHKPGPKPKPKLRRSDIQGAKFLRQIMALLRPLHDHCPDSKRKLHYDEYCAWLLLYFFTPVLDSMRGLQQASEFESIQRKPAECIPRDRGKDARNISFAHPGTPISRSA